MSKSYIAEKKSWTNRVNPWTPGQSAKSLEVGKYAIFDAFQRFDRIQKLVIYLEIKVNRTNDRTQKGQLLQLKPQK